MEYIEKSIFKVMYWTGTKQDRVKGPFEGIAIGSGSGDVDVIVNVEMKIAKSVWDFRALPYEGLIHLKMCKGRFNVGKYARKKK